ncbi:MAG TPA: hypothetical protein VNQ53_08030 [Nocardioides sp.]|nr:hypothetical protein [Nocardioides sp.]
MPTDPAPRLAGDELAQLLGILKTVDSVELKLTVPQESQRRGLAALGADPLEAQIRQVFFFDTPELGLNEAGVVLRARRVQGRDADTVVKLRPVVPGDVSAELRSTPGFGVEVDAMPGGYVCSASLKGRLSGDAVRRSVSGDKALSKMYSKEQRQFFEAHAPSGLTIDDLSVLGPIFVLKLKLPKKTFSRRIVVEMWLYPDGSRILEISTKCQPDEGLDVALEIRQFLEGKGIDLSGQQQTKTKAALEFFSAELMAERRQD